MLKVSVSHSLKRRPLNAILLNVITRKKGHVTLFYYIKKGRDSKNVYPLSHFYKEYHKRKMINMSYSLLNWILKIKKV